MPSTRAPDASYLIQDPMRAGHKALVGLTGLGLTAAALVLAWHGEWVFCSITAFLGLALLGSLLLMLRKTRLTVDADGLACTRWIVRAGEPRRWPRSLIDTFEVTADSPINGKRFYQLELITLDLERHVLLDKLGDRRDADALARHLRRDLGLAEAGD